MATTTTNFGWDIPQSTDLVKDGATAIAALGQDIDTALVDLKGGTTGQILAKASNTDLDYSWVTNDVGDITEVTAGTGLTGGGTSGAVTLSFDQANFGGGQYAAGKNKIINGDFGIWQRGTSFTTNGVYTADRFQMTTTAGHATVSQQTFTPGTAPVAGYEGQYFLRYNATASNTDPRILYPIEDVRTFAGETVTISFWAKSATSSALSQLQFRQNFGSGGSALVDTIITPGFTLTSSWVRYSRTVTVPSISGKTIGAGSNLRLTFDLENSTAFDFDLWGVQVEAGSTASPFQTATGTKQGELAACQRYYWRMQTGASLTRYTTSLGSSSTTDTYGAIANPVPMRLTNPSSVDYANLRLQTPNTTGGINVTAMAMNNAFGSQMASGVQVSVASGLTSNLWYALENATTGGYLGFSAEF
jgi:hypothetical protein